MNSKFSIKPIKWTKDLLRRLKIENSQHRTFETIEDRRISEKYKNYAVNSNFSPTFHHCYCCYFNSLQSCINPITNTLKSSYQQTKNKFLK